MVQIFGVSGNFVRIKHVIIKSTTSISTSILTNWVIRSSQIKGDTPYIEEFHSQWHQVMDYIIDSGIQLENFCQDSLYIENILAKGKYVWVHSPQYKTEYKPHYRVVAREIYEKEFIH